MMLKANSLLPATDITNCFYFSSLSFLFLFAKMHAGIVHNKIAITATVDDAIIDSSFPHINRFSQTKYPCFVYHKYKIHLFLHFVKYILHIVLYFCQNVNCREIKLHWKCK